MHSKPHQIERSQRRGNSAVDLMPTSSHLPSQLPQKQCQLQIKRQIKRTKCQTKSSHSHQSHNSRRSRQNRNSRSRSQWSSGSVRAAQARQKTRPRSDKPRQRGARAARYHPRRNRQHLDVSSSLCQDSRAADKITEVVTKTREILRPSYAAMEIPRFPRSS